MVIILFSLFILYNDEGGVVGSDMISKSNNDEFLLIYCEFTLGRKCTGDN